MAERGRPKAELALTDDERETLERWARRPKSAQALALRCRIVLECASGQTNREVSRRLGVSEPTVSKWGSPDGSVGQFDQLRASDFVVASGERRCRDGTDNSRLGT